MTRAVLYLLAGLILVSDQLTKHWVVQNYINWPEYSREIVPGFFSLTYVENAGGAFGIFHTVQSGTLLLALASAAAGLAIVGYTMFARRPLSSLLAVALGLALGGAVGNLIDRVRLHYVVDFLDLHLGTHQWPVFNVADSAICTGVALLALYYSRAPANTPRPSPVSPQE